MHRVRRSSAARRRLGLRKGGGLGRLRTLVRRHDASRFGRKNLASSGPRFRLHFSVDNGEDLAAVAARLRRADARDVEELFLVDWPGAADGGQGTVAEDAKRRDPAPPCLLEAPLSQLLEERRFGPVEGRLVTRNRSNGLFRPRAYCTAWLYSNTGFSQPCPNRGVSANRNHSGKMPAEKDEAAVSRSTFQQ